MCSYERVRLVGGLVICVRWIWCGRYCWCLAGRWAIVDFLGVVFVQVGSGVLCCVVLCCASPLYLYFVDFFILFGLWCRLR